MYRITMTDSLRQSFADKKTPVNQCPVPTDAGHFPSNVQDTITVINGVSNSHEDRVRMIALSEHAVQEFHKIHSYVNTDSIKSPITTYKLVLSAPSVKG